jgi:hypothetical protein
LPTNRKPTQSKRQREQDQKDRAAERNTRRTERKARAAERVASGRIGPQIAEPAEPDSDANLDRDPATAASSAVSDIGPNARPPGEAAPQPRGRDAMGARLYIGNLSFDTDATAVRELFAAVGEVTDVHLVTDHVSGRPRGFAFVTMASAAAAKQAITELDGQTIQGRPLRVNEAEQRESRGDSRGGGRGRF